MSTFFFFHHESTWIRQVFFCVRWSEKKKKKKSDQDIVLPWCAGMAGAVKALADVNCEHPAIACVSSCFWETDMQSIQVNVLP